MIKNDEMQLAHNCLRIMDEKGIKIKFRGDDMVFKSTTQYNVSTNLLVDISMCQAELKRLVIRQNKWIPRWLMNFIFFSTNIQKK